MNTRPAILFTWISLLMICQFGKATATAVGSSPAILTTSSAAIAPEAAARLLVNRSSFKPTANPKPGETIQLSIELINAGNSASPATTAQFHLPNGVDARRGLSSNIPPIGAGQSHTLDFYFSYNASFQEHTIAIVFETPSITALAGIKKTLFISINSQKRSVPRTQGNEVYWVSPDPDENQGVIRTAEGQVDLKVMALSEGELSKKDFSIRVNGRRAQGSKTDLSKLKSSSTTDQRSNHSFSSSVQLKEGRNEVEVVYYEKDGETIAARTKTFVFYYEPPVKSNVFVLTIGAVQGDSKWSSVAKQVDTGFRRALSANNQALDQVHFYHHISSKAAERMELIKGLAQLERLSIQDQDWVIIYLAAGSRLAEEGEYVLEPSDFDPNYPVVTGLDLNRDILDVLQKMGGKKVLFLDIAYESGAKAKTPSSFSNWMRPTAPSMEILAVDNALANSGRSQALLGQVLLEALQQKTMKVQSGLEMRYDLRDQQLSLEELTHFLRSRLNQYIEIPTGILHRKGSAIPRERGLFQLGQ